MNENRMHSHAKCSCRSDSSSSSCRSPPGYFKKRKCEIYNLQPPEKETYKRHKNFIHLLLKYLSSNCVKLFIVLALIINNVNVNVNATFTEQDLKVLSLTTTSTESTTKSNADNINQSSELPLNTICQNVEIRQNISELQQLRGCRVVEGSINLLALDDLKKENITQLNLTFPDLYEITGYLLIYRMLGYRTLHDLFPNLSVIRGRDLFNNYALIIYEMEDLEEIGLKNLQIIERGSVRIEKNAKLCFASTVDWNAIAVVQDGNEIAKNKVEAHCSKCPSGCKNCWNKDVCQTTCSCPSSKNSKNSHSKTFCNRQGKCCDEKCLGGCDDDDPKKCFACKNFFSGSNQTNCIDKCSAPNEFEYLERRCISKEECRSLNNRNMKNSVHYIPHNGKCSRGCPSDYNEVKENDSYKCTPCVGKCIRRCSPKIIDSIQAAQSLKGCTHIDGPLEITIKTTTKSSQTTSNNSMIKELENALSDVEEIKDYLKIVRSYPIISLRFLKKLKTIRGDDLDNSKYSVAVWDNQNLESLFTNNSDIKILKGKLSFHLNPKLCFNDIMELAKEEGVIENLDTTKRSNGDRNPCNVTDIPVIAKVDATYTVLTWKNMKLGDDRKLLNYVVYHMPTDQNVTIWESREACGNDGWYSDDVNEYGTNDTVTYPMFRLQPHTRYAFYVQAFILASEKINAMSNIQYFTTLPDRPPSIRDALFKVTAINSTALHVKWEVPRRINGKFEKYIVSVKMFPDTKPVRNYCEQPIDPHQLYNEEKKKPTHANDFINSIKPNEGFCDCKLCMNTCDMKDKTEGEDQRLESIEFEDEIQNFVWKLPDDTEDTTMYTYVSKKSKRQAPETFPEDQETQLKNDRHVMLQNELNIYKEFTNVFEIITDFNKNSVTFVNLTHYTEYRVSIYVCREKHGTSPDEDQHPVCSSDTSVNVKTLKDERNDLIQNFKAEIVPSNTTKSSSYVAVRLQWTPPERPNGEILAYNIKYKRIDQDDSQNSEKCVTKEKFMAQNQYYVIEQFVSGNYSLQVAVTSMAGTGNYTEKIYVNIPEQSSTQFLWVVVGLIVFLSLLVALFYVWMMKNRTDISNMKLIANVNPDYAGINYKQDDWEVSREKILLLHELGQGSFGMVYEGIIKDYKRRDTGDIVKEIQCAIKTVNENATDKERSSFLIEASVMKQFDTAFVVKLLGVVSISQPTYVIMELMPNGDLKGYLRSHRAEYNDDASQPPPQPPTIRQMLQMSAEIADGMSYLAAKKYVHRDLAARNCMVAADLTVKIGDFGMTRDIYETDYYRKGTKGLLPVRWMSPESLKDGVFSTASDVFSYGVVLWEIATLASQPYQGFSNDQVLRYVIEGGVMERPENCPDRLYEIMRRCWQHRPSARPTFLEIIDSLRDAVNENFKNVSYFYSKEGQDLFNQQRQGDFSINMTDDVTTPLTLRQDDDDMTSSLDGNNFLMGEISEERRRKLHDL